MTFVLHSVINNTTHLTPYTKDGRLIGCFFSYLEYLKNIKEKPGEDIRPIAYTINKWYDFLERSNYKIEDKAGTDISDAKLKLFRNTITTSSAQNASGDLKKRKRSVNVYLKTIYEYYLWLQKRNPSERIIGPAAQYPLQSTLGVDSGPKAQRDLYPLVYKDVLRKSKHRTTFTPSRDNYDKLYQYILSFHSPLVAERDTTILKIFYHTGWRAGSVASLKTTDFLEERIVNAGDKFIVTPSKQKFDYDNSFEVPINLAESILEYIKGGRANIVERTGSTSEALFLTMQGRPLKRSSIVSSFSKAGKALGLPFGSGAHSWRGSFTENTSRDELDLRAELGLDDSVETVSAVVAKALGHNSHESQQAYIRKIQMRRDSSAAGRHQIERLELQLLVDELRSALSSVQKANSKEIDRLKKKIKTLVEINTEPLDRLIDRN